MIIREFLVLHEHGTVVFHRKYHKIADSKDIVLRSGLISALYTFASQVENDAIDKLQMEKVTLLFKKKENLIFILFLDSQINPELLEEEITHIQREFFKIYPELLWRREIVNIAQFKEFNSVIDRILLPLNDIIELKQSYIAEGYITEEECKNYTFSDLGSLIAKRLLEKFYDSLLFSRKEGEDSVLIQIDNIIEILGGDNIERRNNSYLLNCEKCKLCNQSEEECFFENLIREILESLNLDVSIKR